MNTIRFLALALVAALLLPGCAVIPVPHHVQLDEAELVSHLRPGSGSVSGVILAHDSGQTYFGDQSHLSLLPVCSYTREIIEREIGDGENLGSSDPRLRKYLRFAKAGPGGQFIFPSVPSGDYFLVGLVEWTGANDSEYQWSCSRVHVTSGENTRVQVSENWQHPGRPTLVVWRIE